MYTASIAVDDVIDALADFIQPFCGASEIVRAQVNRVPMPSGECVVLTELFEVDLEYSTVSYNSVDSLANVKGPTRIEIQIDFYGPNAGDYCKAVKNVFRSIYIEGKFPDGVKPLYCTDGIQSPLITGEQQWQSRWTVTAALQYNPVVAVPQEFADVLYPNTIQAADI